MLLKTNLIVFLFVFNYLSKSFRMIKWIVFTFPVLIVMDNLINPQEIMRYNKQDSQNEIETVKNKLKNQYDKHYPAIAYLSGDINENEIKTHLNVMLAAQDLNIPCVNAYTGSFPNEYLPFYFHRESALTQWCDFNSFDINKIQKKIID